MQAMVEHLQKLRKSWKVGYPGWPNLNPELFTIGSSKPQDCSP